MLPSLISRMSSIVLLRRCDLAIAVVPSALDELQEIEGGLRTTLPEHGKDACLSLPPPLCSADAHGRHPASTAELVAAAAALAPSTASHPHAGKRRGGRAPGGTRTHTDRLLRADPLPLGYGGASPTLRSDCWLVGLCRGRLLSPDGIPENRPGLVGLGRIETVGSKNSFHHVGQHGGPGSAPDHHRHHRPTVGPSPQRAVHALEPRGAPETRHGEATAPGRVAERPRGGGKSKGR
jgi:hypothetical protein